MFLFYYKGVMFNGSSFLWFEEKKLLSEKVHIYIGYGVK